MRIIDTVNSTRFSLDGIEYFKNYISEVAGNQITVFNAYDRKDVKVDWEHYGNITLNGVVYGNVADLQSALLPVIYTRASLGGGGGGAVDSVNGQTGVVELGLQEITEQGRTYTQTIGDFTYTFNIFEDLGDGGELLIEVVNNVTNERFHISGSCGGGEIYYDDIDGNRAIFNLTNNASIGQTSSFGGNGIKIPKKTSGSGDAIFQPPNNKPAGNYTLAITDDVSALLTTSITNGDTTHAPNGDAVFDALALKQDKVTGVSDTEIGYLDGVTSSIQTQLDGKVKFIVKTNTTATVTGTTAKTEVLKVTIPANTFASSDQLILDVITTKSGTAGTQNIMIQHSTSATIPSGTTGRIGTFTTASGSNQWNNFHRYFWIEGGNINGYGFGSSAVNDFGAINTAFSSQAFDVTVTNYIYVSITNADAGDTSVFRSARITN